jgi:outer membrane protein assembly factor BamB
MRRKFRAYVLCIVCLTVLSAAVSRAIAGDWPQQNYNNAKTAITPDAPPSDLKLLWTRQLAKPKSAWPASQGRLQFDTSYQPIVAGKLMFVGSMVTDSVTAYDTETGTPVWRFYTSGPVRFAPMACKGRLYVTSDDGYLYCLNAADGKLIWKFLGGPSDRKVIGNGRLTCMWPARTSAIVCDGKVYFGAGIWPFMGTFVHCLDAETGKVIWTTSGTEWKELPHGGAISFSSPAPQGYLAIAGDRLYVPCGRAVPAVLDRKTGKLIHFRQAAGKKVGGCHVTIFGDYYWVPGAIIGTKSSKTILGIPGDDVIVGENIYHASTRGLDILKVTTGKKKKLVLQTQRTIRLESAIGKLFFKAGNFLYASVGDRAVVAIDVSRNDKAKIVWRGKVDGKIWTMIAGDDKLFVITLDGGIYCFGKARGSVVRHELKITELKGSAKWSPSVRKAISAAGTDEGYCVQLGLADGGMVAELVRQSKFHIVVVDADTNKIYSLRSRMEAAGLYGRRVVAFVGDPATFGLPQYLANLIISPLPGMSGVCREGSRAAATLRPYGGVICIADGEDAKVVLKREGPLSGSGTWTHQYGNSARTLVSKDRLVKLPLGILWFGGPPNDDILPRHGHGPSPQVVGGRLFIEGRNAIRAVDVYTGRLLWQREIKNLGRFYDNTRHHPGAGKIGSNYISLPDGIYVMTPESCEVLDPASGKTLHTLTLPDKGGAKDKWGWISIHDDLLVVATRPIRVQPAKLKKGQKPLPVISGKAFKDIAGVQINADYASASKRLIVMDRKSRKVLWSRDAASNFRHNAIVLTGGTVFCIDAMSSGKRRWLKRHGIDQERPGTLHALDARTGKVIWKTDKNVFGTWLSYSKEHDLLIQAGSKYRDRAFDEAPKGITVYRAKSGKVLWSELGLAYTGPLIIHHDRLITNGSSGYGLELLTGKKTGWKWTRMYGCNTAVASENLLTFRSGAAGYYDLTNKSGTGNFGGFKSGCTSNLIAADGVLNAPDYTRTCTCSYQNQSSLALVYMPEVETWTYAGTVRRGGSMGLNFGAPGDRLAGSGTFWKDVSAAGLENPKPSGKPAFRVRITGGAKECFNNHSSLFSGSSHTWVVASGLVGASNITIDTDIKPVAVRLYFAEPDVSAKIGRRVFTVSLDGKEVLKNFDILAAAGGARKAIAKVFKFSKTDGPIEIKLKAISGKTLLCGVELLAGKK